MRHLCISIILYGVLTGCTALPFSDLIIPSCRDRVGECFNATVNGQSVVSLRRDASFVSHQANPISTAVKYDLQNTKWMLPNPVSGELAFDVAPNGYGANWFGSNLDWEVQLQPLNGQQLKTVNGFTTHPDIRLNGESAVSSVRVFDGKSLPTGDYLVYLRLAGTDNWDRKIIYVRVE